MSKFQIQRYSRTITIANSTDHTAVANVALNGLLRGIIAIVPNLTSTHTLTIAITDVDGTTIFSKASIAESGTYSAFIDANNQPLQLPLSGNHTITITSSGTESPAVDIPLVLLIQRG